MKKFSHDKIQAFCTVDPSFLERDGDQIICRKCSREMADLDAANAGKSTAAGSRSKQLLCGVISAAALSSCTVGKIEQPHQKGKFDPGKPSKPNEEETPLPGIYYGSRQEPVNFESTSYPEAKPIKGQPDMVESPYGGHPVDVSNVPPNSLVIDPKFGAESDKFFRI